MRILNLAKLRGLITFDLPLGEHGCHILKEKHSWPVMFHILLHPNVPPARGTLRVGDTAWSGRQRRQAHTRKASHQKVHLQGEDTDRECKKPITRSPRTSNDLNFCFPETIALGTLHAPPADVRAWVFLISHTSSKMGTPGKFFDKYRCLPLSISAMKRSCTCNGPVGPRKMLDDGSDHDDVERGIFS